MPSAMSERDFFYSCVGLVKLLGSALCRLLVLEQVIGFSKKLCVCSSSSDEGEARVACNLPDPVIGTGSRVIPIVVQEGHDIHTGGTKLLEPIDEVVAPDLIMKLHVTLSSPRALIESKGTVEDLHWASAPGLLHRESTEKVLVCIVHGDIASLKLQFVTLKGKIVKFPCEIGLFTVQGTVNGL